MNEAAPATKRLYYFTTKTWGIKALWEKRLKVSRYQEFNDPFELAPFDLGTPEAQILWDQQRARILAGRHGALCFSDDWRSILMWSHYADKHRGLCLGFDVPTRFAEPIEYMDRLLPNPTRLQSRLHQAAEDVLEAALRFKHSEWAYEREWRLRVELNESTDGLFFKKFDDDLHLRQVIVGANCPLSIADVAEAVVNPPLDVDIIQARPSSTSFEVCQHEHVSTHTTKGYRAALRLARDVFHHEMPDDDEDDRKS